MINRLINILIDLLIDLPIYILKCIFERKSTALSQEQLQIKKEKEHRLQLLDNMHSYAVVQNKTVNCAIVEITEYYIEHIFCDYQTFTSSISDILETVPNIKSVTRHRNNIDIKFINLEDITTITLENYRISIGLFDNSTPVKEINMIMCIFKDKINSVINHTEST